MMSFVNENDCPDLSKKLLQKEFVHSYRATAAPTGISEELAKFSISSSVEAIKERYTRTVRRKARKVTVRIHTAVARTLATNRIVHRLPRSRSIRLLRSQCNNPVVPAAFHRPVRSIHFPKVVT